MTNEKKVVSKIMAGNTKITDGILTNAKDYGQLKRIITRYVNSSNLEDYLTS